MMSGLQRKKRFLWQLCIVIISFISVASYALEITKSPNDKRQYAYLRLPNGLQAIVVSDQAATKAAIALEVKVGSFEEPNEYLGLAHFLEHMLFLGTEKYPESGTYQKYVNNHGGSYNAYTENRYTHYYFSISPDFLEKGVDIFSQFFISPLFNDTYVNKEREAVASEYSLYLQNEGWALAQINKVTSNPLHPYSRFSIGNLQTLPNKPGTKKLQEALQKFYKEHYTASRMTVTLVGPFSIEHLTELVKQYFSQIPEHTVKPISSLPLAFEPAQTGIAIQVKPHGDQALLNLQFPIPSQHDYYHSKPASSLLALISYEGKGSLLSLLKKNGWVDEIFTGSSEISKEQDLLSINFLLTKQGFEQINKITEETFGYIQMIREQGYPLSFYDELKTLGKINFQYATPESPISCASFLAKSLQRYPIKEVITQKYLLNGQDNVQEYINNILPYLTPINLRQEIVHPTIIGDKVEPYFNTSYRVIPFTLDLISQWKNAKPHADLALPKPNIFMPKNFTLKSVNNVKSITNVADGPNQLINNAMITLWHKQDKHFQQPKQNTMILLESSLTQDTPKNTLLSDMFVSLVMRDLTEYIYPASLAGTSLGVYSTERGLAILVSGYDDKQAEITTLILDKLYNLTVNVKEFDEIKTQLSRQFYNYELMAPYGQALDGLFSLLVKSRHHKTVLQANMNSLTIENLQQYIPKLLQSIRVTMLIHGNVTDIEAKQFAEVVQKKYINNSEKDISLAKIKVLTLSAPSKQTWLVTPKHNDKSVVLYYQAPKREYETIAKVLLLTDILKGPFYNRLRTDAQLGYVLGVLGEVVLDKSGLVFYVQSPKLSSEEQADKIVQFIDKYTKDIEELSEVQFAQYQQALSETITVKPKSIFEVTSRFWSEIQQNTLRFNYHKMLAQSVNKVTLNSLKEFYYALLRDPEQVRKITVYVDNSPTDSMRNNSRSIEEIDMYKAKVPFL